jgi:hypothetical protein
MSVYVLETGLYQNRGVVGVFRTPEAAIARTDPSVPASRETASAGACATMTMPRT